MLWSNIHHSQSGLGKNYFFLFKSLNRLVFDFPLLWDPIRHTSVKKAILPVLVDHFLLFHYCSSLNIIKTKNSFLMTLNNLILQLGAYLSWIHMKFSMIWFTSNLWLPVWSVHSLHCSDFKIWKRHYTKIFNHVQIHNLKKSYSLPIITLGTTGGYRGGERVIVPQCLVQKHIFHKKKQ